jgi:hypothetical protein
MDNFIAFVIFISIIVGVLLYDSNAEITIKICKTSDGNVVFAGEKIDYDFLVRKDLISKGLVCSERLYKKQDWYTLKNITKRSINIK